MYADYVYDGSVMCDDDGDGLGFFYGGEEFFSSFVEFCPCFCLGVWLPVYEGFGEGVLYLFCL